MICLEPLNDTGHVLSGCSHAFHVGCIVEWFRQGHSNCPLCRTDPEFCSPYERARAVRAFARRRSAPADLVRQVKRIRTAEERSRDASRSLRAHLRDHRDAIQTYRKLLRSERSWRWKARVLLRGLANYAHPALRIPLLRTD